MKRTLTPANIRRIQARIVALGQRTTERCERDALRAEGENLHAKMRELDAENERLRAALESAQELRPLLLAQYGTIPKCVLNFCNRARAALKVAP